MDQDTLNTFLMVVDKGSFSLAALSLHLTQPAVSKRISMLEAELGSRLLDRVSRKLTLTEAGRELIPRATQILNAMEETKNRIRGLSEDVSGSLSLTTNHHIGLWRLPELLKIYQQRYPQVVLDLNFMDSEPAHEKILKGDVELGLLTLAPKLHPQLLATPLWNDPLIFISSLDDPLILEENIPLSRLANLPAILPDISTFTGRIVRDTFNQEGLSLLIRTSTNYLETIKMLATLGLGWSVLPKTMMDASLKELDVKAPLVTRTLGLIHHHHRTLSRPCLAFLDLARTYQASV